MTRVDAGLKPLEINGHGVGQLFGLISHAIEQVLRCATL